MIQELVNYFFINQLLTLEPLSEEGEEHGEVDGAGGLVHHALEVLVGRVLAEGGEHVVEVLLVDEAVPVLVDHVEGLLELLDLVLVEHGEDVGGGALGALLGGAAAAGGFAGRHLARGKEGEESVMKLVFVSGSRSGCQMRFFPRFIFRKSKHYPM